MIRAVIFDQDGTLVQSEKLKALFYATAVQRPARARATERTQGTCVIVWGSAFNTSHPSSATRQVISAHRCPKVGLTEHWAPIDNRCFGT